ncbi:MAG TPA: hypothetical protein VK335_24875 [Bryobacteraceae bacterium]|nr:hypothetical protein [Bryobacteraceae bacterium]
MNQKEEEESKCREFVDELNRLAAHERYRYIGHVSELEPREFSDCLIKDRRTSKELHVGCTRYSPSWMTVERANMQLLEKRFACDLRSLGYDNYTIFLQARNWQSHPLQKLNRSGVEDLARSIKQFLVDHKPKTADQTSAQFNLDDFPRYAPLVGMFQLLLLTKFENPQSESRPDDGSPIVRVGVIGYEAGEMALRLEQTITSKLGGPGDTVDILMIYSEGPLFVYDVQQTNLRLKEIAEARHAQQSFGEIWFLAHYWTRDQKLYRVV